MIYQLTGIDYSFDYPISPQDLQQLFQETDWANNRNLNDIKKMLNGSSIVIGAWSNGELIGFARVITDNVFRALIDDVIIHPIKRGKGVGSNLIQKLIDRLTELKIEEIFLRYDQSVGVFYKKLGFEISQSTTMDLKTD